MFKVFDTDVHFSSNQAELMKHNGERIKILDILPPTKCDISDVGIMFQIQFEDSTGTDAFNDEVSIEILSHPDMYADEHTEYEFAQLECENSTGGLVRFSMGVDDEGEFYLTAEDDEYAEDYYVDEDGESFEDIFYDLVKKVMLNKPIF